MTYNILVIEYTRPSIFLFYQQYVINTIIMIITRTRTTIIIKLKTKNNNNNIKIIMIMIKMIIIKKL